ncbi:MAG: protein-S-isoprenylcysteine methyltransferase, partial [Novosphingobium sp.]
TLFRSTTLLALVSAVYYWRARTEEQHLCAEDAKYREYSEWMQRNGLITRPLHALAELLRSRRPRLQPNE